MQEYKIGEYIRVRALMSAFEALYADDFYFGGENHNFWEIVYVMDGKVGVSADGHVYELSSGEIIFHKPMEFHKIWALPPEKPHVFIVSFFADGSRMTEFENGVFKLSYTQKEYIEDLIRILRKHAKEKEFIFNTKSFLDTWQQDDVFSQIAGNAMERFFLSLLVKNTQMPMPEETKSAKIYQDVVRVLEEHVEEWISVEEVARLCASSVSNIKKVFGKYSNHGIHKYFLKMKIIRAVHMLEEGASVQQISERLSFNNPNYFSMVFKRETGFSPIQYRKIFLMDTEENREKIPPILMM